MKTRTPASAVALLAVASVLLGGCTSDAKAPNPPPQHQEAVSGAAAPNAVPVTTPPLSDVAKKSPNAVPATTPPLSDAAKMICTDETRGNIATVLAARLDQKQTATWKNGTYTCTYRVHGGPIVLSVHESPDVATATTYTAHLRHATPGTKDLTGLTPAAFGTTDGVVVLQKGNDTLRVDTSGLRPQSGLLYKNRKAFAYGIATTILGCWTGG